MSNYSARAGRYQVEFATTVDFDLIRKVLARTDGPIVDVPCGAGRLLPLYTSTSRIVHMFDLEQSMIRQCDDLNRRLGLQGRVLCKTDDLRTWKTAEPAGLVLIARGGLQMLESTEELEPTLRNIHANLSENGLVYIDIHDPWADGNGHSDLPDFLNFGSKERLTGETRFALPNGELIREFVSSRRAAFVNVSFRYREVAQNRAIVQFDACGRWLRITHSNLIQMAQNVGLVVLQSWGNYDEGPYSSERTRMIAIMRR